MRRVFLSSLCLLIFFTLLTGIAYPLALDGIGEGLFSHQANGSLIRNSAGQVVGSSLIGQSFADAKNPTQWFQSRPSADNYDAMASGGNALGPSNPVLYREIDEALRSFVRMNQLRPNAPIPIDAVTASGSGLDPEISIANALLQAPRVAKSRNVSLSYVKRLIAQATSSRNWGIFGAPGVNVVELNLLLEKTK